VLRHEFQPGRLIAGLFLILAGVMYAGDAGGLWDTPWFAIIPVVTLGLCLAGAVGVLTRVIRKRRRPGGTEPVGAQPSPSGAQPEPPL
jgi:drug/metabolite transporter (DMT)-like permease